ncbi:MAG: hypothetical protein WAZ19_14415 [Anaerolineae bacterium]
MNRPVTRRSSLLALLALALLVSLYFTGQASPALADLLFQSPSTPANPNSPLPTPTATLVATNTPLAQPTPTATDTALPNATATPTALPGNTIPPASTGTPLPQPTNTAPAPATATVPPPAPGVTPNNTVAAPTDLPPLPADSGQPGLAPTRTPQPILPPPAVPLAGTATITATQSLTGTNSLISGTAPSAPRQSLRERLDPVLFIDNLVVAFGYVWMCFATLIILALTLAAILFVGRRRARQNQAVPPLQPETAPPRPFPTPPSAPPASPRVAARRRPSPPPPDLE